MAIANKKYKKIPPLIIREEHMLASPAYRDLKPLARCLLEEFQRIYRPDRNGRLSISEKNAGKLLGVNPKTASKGFHDLAEHGFIALENRQIWQERRAREWRLTFEPCNGHEPTHDWLDWCQDKTARTASQKKSRPRKPVQSAPENGATLPQKMGQAKRKVNKNASMTDTIQ